MLSVLIPVYNFDVRTFLSDLSAQAATLSAPCEIICLDDKSEESFRALNRMVGELPHVRYIESDVNLGRSAIRNRLEEEASYDHLLFLDCDGRVLDTNYLQRFVDVMDFEVVYGGRVYPPEAPADPKLHFHWYVGMAREEILDTDRRKAPYKSFMTNNFMIQREVFRAVRMDESVQGYGHEDTLFAMDLKRKGVRILHIQNALEHIGIEPVDVFLRKSERGVHNLSKLVKEGRVDDSIKLVRYYHRLKRWGLMGLVAWWVNLREQSIMRNLRGSAPNLMWFDLWKLARLAKELGAG